MILGGAGDDTLYGQDGNDTMNGNDSDDDMYGELGNDTMSGDAGDAGDAGDDAMLGDRLLDWNGAYNLYTHCNAAHGGFNDVRQWSPTMQSFLQQWAAAEGAGQATTDVTTTTAATGAFDELALTYQGDINGHGAGSDFPNTAGHFVDIACSE